MGSETQTIETKPKRHPRQALVPFVDRRIFSPDNSHGVVSIDRLGVSFGKAGSGIVSFCPVDEFDVYVTIEIRRK